MIAISRIKAGKQSHWCLGTAVLLALFVLPAQAQESSEYLLEVGTGAGLTTYEGDFNSNLLTGMQPAFALVAKYKQNPRMAWTAALTYSKLKGSSKDASTWYPADPDVLLPTVVADGSMPAALDWTFDNPVMDLTLRYEYNFWAYGTGREFYGARRVAPFLTLGMGLTYADAKPGVLTAKLPIGGGVKIKIAERLNLTAEWVMNFTGSDKLDGKKDPYGIQSSGLFKNNDCYSTMQVTVTYDLLEKCKTCNNDR